jgi:hypothetical protein
MAMALLVMANTQSAASNTKVQASRILWHDLPSSTRNRCQKQAALLLLYNHCASHEVIIVIAALRHNIARHTTPASAALVA